MTTEPKPDRPRLPEAYGVPTGARGLLEWRVVERRLEAADVVWLATTGPAGRPHVRPVAATYVDGRIFVSGRPETRWLRNLEANREASAHLDGGHDVVIVEGVVASWTADRALAERLAARHADAGIGAEAFEGRLVHALVPRVVYAWREFPADVTRFTFSEPTDGR
jgi:Pyridoxamine 5'-phosphate oxidase